MAATMVEPLNPDVFAPYGRVLTQPRSAPDADREDLKAWIGFSDLLGLAAKEPVLTYLLCSRHTLPVDRLERHCQGAEAFIPLTGKSILVCAPVTDPDDPAGTPDESAIRAFLLDGSVGVFLPRGSWHWAPFPITESASFILLMDKNIGDDIDIREITPRTLQLY